MGICTKAEAALDKGGVGKGGVSKRGIGTGVTRRRNEETFPRMHERRETGNACEWTDGALLTSTRNATIAGGISANGPPISRLR